MSIPDWLLETVAAVALLVAALSAGQLVVTRAWTGRAVMDADIPVAQLLIGVAAAGVLVSGLHILPSAAWAVVFAAATAWFDWRLWRDSRARGASVAVSGRYAAHLAYSAAMLYLFTALARSPSGSSGGSGMAGMPGMSGGSGSAASGLPTLPAPTLALAFALLLIAFTVRDMDRRASTGGSVRVAGRRQVSAGAALVTAASGGGGSITAPPSRPTPADTVPPAQTAAERWLLAPGVLKGRRVVLGVIITFLLIVMI